MKLKDLARMAKDLPDIDWGMSWKYLGDYEASTLAKEIKTVKDASTHIQVLKDRMELYAKGLSKLAYAYTKLREVILEAEVNDV